VTATSNNIQWQTAKGWLKDNERQLLFELASQLPGNAALLNLGVEFGASLACLRAGSPAGTIYGVDLDISKAVSGYGCILIQEDSHQLVKEWTKPLDLIFVDGDHGELGVFLDAGFADYLRVGCYVLFQDVWDWEDTSIIHQVCPGVHAGVERWLAQPHIKQEFEELPSVETTRVFRRIKAGNKNEQPRVANSSGFVADISTERNAKEHNQLASKEPQIRGGSTAFSRG
jgi:hypothetical protein